MTPTTSQRKIKGQIPKTKLTALGDPNPKTGAWTQPEGMPRGGQGTHTSCPSPLSSLELVPG